jgi:spectrin beta
MKNTALKMEILRQQKLEQLAAQFHQKIGLRNGYLDEMILVLSDSRYGSNLSNVEASLKKHQAISADILSRENRFKDIEKKMEYFEEENYHAKAAIRKLGNDVLVKWEHLLELLNKHQQKLELDAEMLAHLRDLETVHASVLNKQDSLDSEEFQKAANIEQSMQKLNLYESETNAIQDSIKRLKTQGKQFSDVKGPIAENVAKNLESLETDYRKLSSNFCRVALAIEDSFL